MTAARSRNRDVHIAIGVSVALHVVLILWVVWELGAQLAAGLLLQERVQAEEEVTLLYPEQIQVEAPPLPEQPPPLPVPKLEPQQYIRTTQNQAAAQAPAKADFVSDRNTVAASPLPPDSSGQDVMPSLDGIDPARNELANRDYKDGIIKEDGATPTPALVQQAQPPAPPIQPLSILKPQPSEPAGTPKPSQPGPPAPVPPAPAQVAKAEPLTPLEAMMKERDESDTARIQLDRLPLEVKRAEIMAPSAASTTPPTQVEPAPPLPEPRGMPEMRQPQETPATAKSVPPIMPRPASLLDPVTRTAGPQDADAFSPFTRTSKVRGTISNRGEAAVNAAETPVGRYMRAVTSAVEKRWHTLRRRRLDSVTFGELQLRFQVKADGSVGPPTILSDRRKADPRMIDFTLQAILEAEIPPIPQDLLPLLDRGCLEVEYDVLIY